MRKQYRWFLFAVLVPALWLGRSVAAAEAAQAEAMNWSDPAAWPDNKVPAAGDKVTIEAGKEVILDVSPPALDGLTINGKLSFADTADLELTTEWIMVHGELAIGTEAAPYTHKATITLTDNVKDEQIMGMGDRGIMLSGGTLNLHGDTTNSWTKLASTAKAGSNSIKVLNASGWRVGDVIVLASTDFDPHQAEKRTIAAISGNTITLDRKLDYMHFGKITYGVDERGEVGILTRNILIQASPDADQTLFGGHIMAMVTSKMYVEGVELNRMGQNMHLARYPIHWHLVGDAKGQYIKNSAIHDTYSRCVTVHGTNYVRCRKQCDLQHHRSLLLPRRRRGARQPVRPQPGDPDQVSSGCALCPDQPRAVRIREQRQELRSDRPERQGHPDPVRQHGVVFLDHQPGQRLPRQRRRGVRRDRFLVRLSAASDGRIRRYGYQQGHLAKPDAGPAVHGQHRPFELRRPDDGPRPQGRWPFRRRRVYRA